MLTLNNLIEVASTYLPIEVIKAEIEKYMIRGELLDFSTITLSKEFMVEFKDEVPVISVIPGTNLKNYYNW